MNTFQRSFSIDAIANSSQCISDEDIKRAVAEEGNKLEFWMKWLCRNLPNNFSQELTDQKLVVIARALVNFKPTDHTETSIVKFDNESVVMCLDSSHADELVLQTFRKKAILGFRAYSTREPFPGKDAPLRLTYVEFATYVPAVEKHADVDALAESVTAAIADEKITLKDVTSLLSSLNDRFLTSMSVDRLAIAAKLYFQTRDSDFCQYTMLPNHNWKEEGKPSLVVMLAWRNTPKVQFLHKIFKVFSHNGLEVQRISSTYIEPYKADESTIIMSLSLHGLDSRAAYEVVDLDFLASEIATIKSFRFFDQIYESLVNPGHITLRQANLLRAMINFVHQILLDLDINLYAFSNVREGFYRHPEITKKILDAFEYKFNPKKPDLELYEKTCAEIEKQLDALDTGFPQNDTRRRNVLKQGLNMVRYTLKTNYFVTDKLAISFRMDPQYLDHTPTDRKAKYPELPFGIFYVKGLHFFGFQVRFRDLARGGLRTVIPRGLERTDMERQNIFTEIYNLAYTQHKKNKDIPESGSKSIIFLAPHDELVDDTEAMRKELINSRVEAEEAKKIMSQYTEKANTEILYSTQRAFVTAFMDIINWDEEKNQLRKADSILDYYKVPEYIYLGPDENMHNVMIDWISEYSKQQKYTPLGNFISGRATMGFNHKFYGVTSLGVHTYMSKVLEYLGFGPDKPFTIKISGGPDGDVGGNMIRLLQRHNRNTAKLVVITDGSGTIYDPNGLDLDILVEMFGKVHPCKFYPPEKLSEGGFLLDLTTTRALQSYQRETLCWRKKNGAVEQDWLSASEANKLFKSNAHQTHTDIFVPCGGRPRTLDGSNWSSYLDSEGKPTSKAIVEGANLYLTEDARRKLEELGVIVVKDSSANKCGVITSSYEVLCGLALTEEEFLKEKERLIADVLGNLKTMASREAELLLREHKKSKNQLTKVSEKISAKIIKYTDAFLELFAKQMPQFDNSESDPLGLLNVYFSHCPQTLRTDYRDALINKVPRPHIAAILASTLASQIVYSNGIDWEPSVVNLLPVIVKQISQ